MSILLWIIIAILFLAILLYGLVKFNVIDLYDFCGEEERRNKLNYYYHPIHIVTFGVKRVNCRLLSEHTVIDRYSGNVELFISRKQHEELVKIHEIGYKK